MDVTNNQPKAAPYRETRLDSAKPDRNRGRIVGRSKSAANTKGKKAHKENRSLYFAVTRSEILSYSALDTTCRETNWAGES